MLKVRWGLLHTVMLMGKPVVQHFPIEDWSFPCCVPP